MSSTAPPLALPAEIIELRRDGVAAEGVFVSDHVNTFAQCTKCTWTGLAGLGTNVSSAPSFDAFVYMASEAAAEFAKGKESTCKVCGAPTRVAYVTYHAFFEAIARDLLFVWKPKAGLFGKPKIQLLECDLAGAVEELRPLDDDEKQTFAHDSVCREAWFCLAFGDVKTAVDRIQPLFEAHPAHPTLLRLVEPLLGAGYARASQEIADVHTALYPSNADGWFWSGEALFRSIVHGIEPEARLVEVRERFERTLAQEPEHRRAKIALCYLLRAEGREAEANAAFATLLEHAPDCWEARYQVACALLDDAPASALEHFTACEQWSPEFPAFAVGCARALVALGRKEAAREALARARRLTDAHPHFAELEAALGDGVTH